MKPRISTYRYGSPRQTSEGLRLGVARHVPRGIRREDWQRGGYFDLWVPLLAPTPELVAKYRQKKVRFGTFARLYQNQMKAPASRQVIDLLATFALFLPISVGCYCEDENLCHRSVLRKLILKAAETKTEVFENFLEMRESGNLAKYASPVCFRDLEKE